jgi:hypothetical protein
MGSPLVADGDDCNAAKVNQFVAAADGKLSVFMKYARIHYDGADWVVDSATDSCGIVTGDLAWNGTDDQLEITIDDFADPPVIIVTPTASADTVYNVKAQCTDATTAVIIFYDIDTGAQETTEGTDMDVQVLLLGTYV